MFNFQKKSLFSFCCCGPCSLSFSPYNITVYLFMLNLIFVNSFKTYIFVIHYRGQIGKKFIEESTSTLHSLHSLIRLLVRSPLASCTLLSFSPSLVSFPLRLSFVNKNTTKLLFSFSCFLFSIFYGDYYFFYFSQTDFCCFCCCWHKTRVLTATKKQQKTTTTTT